MSERNEPNDQQNLVDQRLWEILLGVMEASFSCLLPDHCAEFELHQVVHS